MNGKCKLIYTNYKAGSTGIVIKGAKKNLIFICFNKSIYLWFIVRF